MGDLRNVLLLLFASTFRHSSCDLGFVHMTSTDGEVLEECSNFNPEFSKYPVALSDDTKGKEVFDVYPRSGCITPTDPSKYKGRIVIMKRHSNCTFAERARVAQTAGSKGILIVSDTGFITPAANKSDYGEIDITVAVVTNDSYENFHRFIKEKGIEKIRAKQYAPSTPFYDPNAIVMWFLAVLTCSLGAWMQASYYASPGPPKTSTPSSGGKQEERKKNDELDISGTHAVVFFGMCSISILLMYYFYNYLVYIIIGIFCLASCTSLFDLLYNCFRNSNCFLRYRVPKNNAPIFRSRPPILGIVLFIFCATLPVFWAVNRKESYAWILQDILGFSFCIHMIKQLRLPNFKVSCILLILFFLYDIFYVFVTPLLTKNSESIMVKVATGGEGATEELPMLFKLPRFLPSPYSKCGPLPYSMLGYGDVILPGIHVGFCAVWDFKISNTIKRHCYFISAVIGYGTGLILTFVGMYLMRTGQPALLYLTPCCLLSTIFVALKRHELRNIWKGSVPTKSQVAPSSSVDLAHGEEVTLLLKNNA